MKRLSIDQRSGMWGQSQTQTNQVVADKSVMSDEILDTPNLKVEPITKFLFLEIQVVQYIVFL